MHSLPWHNPAWPRQVLYTVYIHIATVNKTPVARIPMYIGIYTVLDSTPPLMMPCDTSMNSSGLIKRHEEICPVQVLICSLTWQSWRKLIKPPSTSSEIFVLPVWEGIFFCQDTYLSSDHRAEPNTPPPLPNDDPCSLQLHVTDRQRWPGPCRKSHM